MAMERSGIMTDSFWRVSALRNDKRILIGTTFHTRKSANIFAKKRLIAGDLGVKVISPSGEEFEVHPIALEV